MKELDDFLASIKWLKSPLMSESLRGLSNRNFLIHDGNASYVVRLASPGSERFGISRPAELEVLRWAEAIGIGPEVVHHRLPEGHLVVRWIPAKEIGLTPERFRDPEILSKIVAMVRRVHAFPPIDHRFDPIGRIRAAFTAANAQRIELPKGSDLALEHLSEIEASQGDLVPSEFALCHNDLFAGNIMDSDPIRIIDWEFAGMGDVFFDLATLVVACDEFAPLGDAHRRVILNTYFNAPTARHRRRLDDMVFVVRLHVVAWGITHAILGTPAQGWEGFTFLGFAGELLEQLLKEL